MLCYVVLCCTMQCYAAMVLECLTRSIREGRSGGRPSKMSPRRDLFAGPNKSAPSSFLGSGNRGPPRPCSAGAPPLHPHTFTNNNIQCYAMLRYGIRCCNMQRYAMLCHSMQCYAASCYTMLCYAMLHYAVLCYAMLCCTMLYYAMLYCDGARMLDSLLPRGEISRETRPWPEEITVCRTVDRGADRARSLPDEIISWRPDQKRAYPNEILAR